MSKTMEKPTPSRIILLGQNLQQLEQEIHSFKLKEEESLQQTLAEINFNDSMLIKNNEETVNPKVARIKKTTGWILLFIGLGFLIFTLTFNLKHIGLALISASLPFIGLYLVLGDNFSNEFLKSEIQQQAYEKVAVVAKYNPQVRVYAKQQLEKNRMLRNEDYFYLKINAQHEIIERFLEKGLDSKRQAIKEIIGKTHNET